MLSKSLTKYIDLHQSLGFKFRTQRSLLRNFVNFAEAHGDEFVQVARVLDWAGRAPSPPQRRNRLSTVRRFAMALHAEDRRHELPPADASVADGSNGGCRTSIGRTRSQRSSRRRLN